MSLPSIVALLLNLHAAAPAAPAPAPSAPVTTLTPAQADAVVDAVLKKISDHYLIKERRKPIVAEIRAAQKRGRYRVDNPTELAARLGEDLAAAGRDKHLGVYWAPAEYRAALAPPKSAEFAALLFAEGRRRNQGVEELKILEGNVRYLKYSQFMWEPDVSGPAIDGAMRFLAGGDAVIVDLRGNGGGDASAVQYLVSHFMGEPGRLLVTFHDELTGETRESRVLESLPAGRIRDRPIYVLIDGGTGSAAEEFTYHFKHFKLGTLVGRTTAGAAHNNAVLPVAPGFMVSVSVGQPVHPVTRGNWEAKGIAPDTATTSAAALDTALQLALRTLEARATDPRLKAGYAWSLAGVEARRSPRTVDAAELARHAGRYGDRTVRVDGGRLVYARPGRDDLALVPMGDGLFGLPGTHDRRLRFVGANGRTTALEVLFADGQRQSFARAD